MSKKFLFFDTETTGLPSKGGPSDPMHAQAIQLAAVLADEKGNVINSLATVMPAGPDPTTATEYGRSWAGAFGVTQPFSNAFSIMASSICFIVNN